MTEGELIAAIVEDPDAYDRWLLYGDWLLERGDVRGEIINLELAVAEGRADPDTPRRIRRLAADNKHRLFSPRLVALFRVCSITVARGFIGGATLRGYVQPSTDDPLSALFDDPHGGLLRSLTFDDGAYWQGGPLGQYLAVKAPWLERLALHGGVSVARLHHRHLRELAADALTCPAVMRGEAELPSLQTLEWRAAFDVPDELFTNPRSLLAQPPPGLTRMVLRAQRFIVMNQEEAPSAHTAPSIVPLMRTRAAGQLAELVVEEVGPHMLHELLTGARELRHLRRVELQFAASMAQRDPDSARAFRERVESHFRGISLTANWPTGEPRTVPEVDESSRGPDGRIDAASMFRHGSPRR